MFCMKTAAIFVLFLTVVAEYIKQGKNPRLLWSVQKLDAVKMFLLAIFEVTIGF